jgi:hypothetical protein
MECPMCGLLNPDTAQRCDCGFDFPSGTMMSSLLDLEELRKARGGGALAEELPPIWHHQRDRTSCEGREGRFRPLPPCRRLHFPASVKSRPPFNPHSSRFGSVQRIVSEVLRPNRFAMPRASSPEPFRYNALGYD